VPEGLNEKKLGAVIVLIVALVAPAMTLTGYVTNALDPWHPGPIPSLEIRNISLTKNAGNLNVSFSIQNYAEEAEPINALVVVNVTQNGLFGTTVYVNGTSINCAASPLFEIKHDDTILVSMIIPYVNYPYALSALHNAGIAVLNVHTSGIVYYKECSLSGGFSG
jgi:hypothetical protein